MYIHFASTMDGTGVVLIAVSSTDIASTNQSDALMKLSKWDELDPVEGYPAYQRMHARIWVLPGSILREDFLGRRWQQVTG